MSSSDKKKHEFPDDTEGLKMGVNMLALTVILPGDDFTRHFCMELEQLSCKKAKTGEFSDGSAPSEMEALALQLVQIRPDLVPNLIESSSQTESSAQSSKDGHDFNELMHVGYKELHLVIAWARGIPGFPELQMTDRIALIKSSFMDLMILRLAYRSLETPGRLKFADKFVLSVDENVELGWNRSVCSSTIELVDRFRELDLDLTEYSILCAIVLLYPDAVGIIDKEMVIGLQNRMLQCLNVYCMKRFPDKLNRYGKIIIRMTVLRTLSANGLEHLMKLINSGRWKMEDILMEIMS